MNCSAAAAACRTGRTTCRTTRFVMPASRSSRTRPPTSSVFCTVETVFCSVVSGNSKYSCSGLATVLSDVPTIRYVVRPPFMSGTVCSR